MTSVSEPAQRRASASTVITTPLHTLIRQAAEHVEQEPSPDLDDEGRVTTRLLLCSMADALAGVGPGPELEAMDAKTRALTVELEARLFTTAAARAGAAGLEPSELVALMGAFARLRRHLAAARASIEQPWIRAGSVHLAHDFRAPLTSILFLADSLRRGQGGAVNEVQKRQLGIICSATLGLSTLANDVIEFARPGQRLLDWQPSRFSIRELLDSTTDLVQPLCERRGVELHTRAPADDVRTGHPTTLGRVLLNLTTNALQATEEGWVEVTARDVSDDGVEFSVRDTGPGLDRDAQARLFEPFQTHRGTARLTLHGYGLGLSICRKLVAAMRSELHYETSPGWGTRFHFVVQLPRSAAARM